MLRACCGHAAAFVASTGVRSAAAVRSRSALVSKSAELKNLLRAPRCCMFVPPGAHQSKHRAECPPKTGTIVTHHGQTAAPFGAIRRKGRDDGVATSLQGAFEACDVSLAILPFGEEMERRPIMPDIIGLGWFPARRVGNKPIDLHGTTAKTGFGGLQCCRGQIEHGDVPKTILDEAVNQT